MASLSNFKFVKGDICSADFSHILREENVDTVMHFAAQTHVDKSFENSLEFTEDNIRGTYSSKRLRVLDNQAFLAHLD